MNSPEKEFSTRYLYYVRELLTNIYPESIADVIQALDKARLTGGTVFLAGNGGSAATCSHFAEDLNWGARNEKRFRAISLTDNAPFLTAVANDKKYEDVFLCQLEILFNTGDVLIVISASGNSLNVVKAVEYVNKRGGTTIGLVGFDGGRLRDICCHCIHVRTKIGEYGVVEGIHSVLTHLITMYLAKGE